jgi:hypothetical protein
MAALHFITAHLHTLTPSQKFNAIKSIGCLRPKEKELQLLALQSHLSPLGDEWALGPSRV